MNIIGINSSPYKAGKVSELLDVALDQCKKEGAETKVFHLADVGLPFFHGRYEKIVPEKYKDFFDAIVGADGIILASPVHWFNISSMMKNLIDWMTILELDNFRLEGKAASFIVVCEEDGGQQAIANLMSPLSHMGFLFPPYAGLFYNKNMKDKSELGWMDKEPRLIATNLVKLIKNTSRLKWDYADIK